MYMGTEEEHFGVEMVEGRMRVSWDIGNHPTSYLYSMGIVGDGELHKVSA